MLVTVVGCIPQPLDIALPQAESRLVIASQVVPGDIMIVVVSRSFDALEFSEEESDTVAQELLEQLLVDSALVTISYNGLTDTLFQIPNVAGLYASIGTPQFLNVDYLLEVTDSLGTPPQSVNALSRMLTQVAFNTASVDTGTNAFGTYVDVSYSFTDPPEDNWYMVNYYTPDTGSASAGAFLSGGSGSTVTQLLSDKTFESSTYVDTFRLEAWPNDTILVSISNISETYFDFLSLRERGSNFFTDLVKEPLSYPTNVNGGYGFFNTHFPDLRVLTF